MTIYMLRVNSQHNLIQNEMNHKNAWL